VPNDILFKIITEIQLEKKEHLHPQVRGLDFTRLKAESILDSGYLPTREIRSVPGS
jgi:hypothetical protein